MKVELYITPYDNNNKFPKVIIDGGTYYVEAINTMYDSIWCDMIEADSSILTSLNEYEFLNFDEDITKKVIIDLPISDELMMYVTLKYPDIIRNNILFS